jgi:hypothetical protein
MLKPVPVLAPFALPTIFYRSPGPHAGPPIDGKSTTYECLGVKTDTDATQAVAAGWWPTLPEAVDPSARLHTEPSPVVDVKWVRSFVVATDGTLLEATENDEPSKTTHLADLAVEATETPVAVDLSALDVDDLKAIAKDLDGYDGRMGKVKLIALIEAAQKAG